jgi:hypothetical protein
MKRTLLAVGFAVPVSMMLAPHGNKYVVYGFGPFFSKQGLTKAHPGDWYLGWLGTGIFYGTIMTRPIARSGLMCSTPYPELLLGLLSAA